MHKTHASVHIAIIIILTYGIDIESQLSNCLNSCYAGAITLLVDENSKYFRNDVFSPLLTTHIRPVNYKNTA